MPQSELLFAPPHSFCPRGESPLLSILKNFCRIGFSCFTSSLWFPQGHPHFHNTLQTTRVELSPPRLPTPKSVSRTPPLWFISGQKGDSINLISVWKADLKNFRSNPFFFFFCFSVSFVVSSSSLKRIANSFITQPPENSLNPP